MALLLAVASLGALSPSQLDELALEHCHGRVFLDGGSNTGDSVRSFLSGAPTSTVTATAAAAATAATVTDPSPRSARRWFLRVRAQRAAPAVQQPVAQPHRAGAARSDGAAARAKHVLRPLV